MSASLQDAVLCRAEIAKRLGVSEAQVSNLMNGKVSTVTPFPHFSVGSRKFTRESWLNEWIERERQH